MGTSKIASVDAWYSPHCDTTYSVSLWGDNDEEIKCIGGADDIEEAWAMAVEEAETRGVPARLIPYESGEVTREYAIEPRVVEES